MDIINIKSTYAELLAGENQELLRERLGALEDDFAAPNAKAQGLSYEYSNALQRLYAAEATQGQNRAEYAKHNVHVPEAVADRDAQAVAAAQRAIDAIAAEQEAQLAGTAPARRVVEIGYAYLPLVDAEYRKYLGTLPGPTITGAGREMRITEAPRDPRPGVEYVELPLPDGDDAELVAEQRDLLGEVRREIARTTRAEQPPAEVMEALEKQLDALRMVPAVEVDFNGRGGPKIRFTPSGRGDTDIRAEVLAAHLSYDQLMADIKAQVIKHFDTSPHLVLSKRERGAQMRALRTELLDIERIECGLIWRARAVGTRIPFRADVDPRALLGVADYGDPKQLD